MKHIFVFDPKSFFRLEWKMDIILDSIGEFFRTQEKPDFSIQYSRYRRNVISIITEEIEKVQPGEIVRVYAIGGNEIIFDCLNGVSVFPDMQLAVIPFGNENDFLRIFGEENFDFVADENMSKNHE